MADDLRMALTNLLRKAEMTGDVRQRGLRDARDVPQLQRGRDPRPAGPERGEHDAEGPGGVRPIRLRPRVPGRGVTRGTGAGPEVLSRAGLVDVLVERGL